MEYEQSQLHTTTADQVLKKLDAEQVTPIGRWHFVLKNNSFWALWGVSVLVGACATAATIFVFLNAGWRYEAITHDSFMQFFFDVMPLFWLVSFALMVLFGYYNVRHTARGYRFSFYLVVVASVVLSFLGGTLLYALGVGKDIDDFRRPLPFSAPLLIHEESRWNNAEKGLLAGEVLDGAPGDSVVIVQLFSGVSQAISLTELDEVSRSILQPHARVRIIGKRQEVAGTDIFVACVVLPWDLPHMQKVLPGEMGERKEFVPRTTTCKDVRPYQRYQEIVITN